MRWVALALLLAGCAAPGKQLHDSIYFKACKAACEKAETETRGIQETETGWKCFCEKRAPDPT